MKRIIIVMVILTIGLSVALTYRLRQQESLASGPAGGTGTIEGVEVRITSRMASRITALHAQEGDRVTKGQVLVELDCAEPEAVVAQARAQLAVAKAGVEAASAQAEAASAQAVAAKAAVSASGAQAQVIETSKSSAAREAGRLASLKTAGGVSDSRVDHVEDQVLTFTHQLQGVKANQRAARAHAKAAGKSTLAAQAQISSAESAVAAAQAGVARAAVMVGECRLVAPRDGVVLSRNLEPGEAVLPGTHIITMVDLSEARATFYLPNAELAAAAPGLEVTVRADAYPGLTFAGTIIHVSSRAEFTPKNVQTREDRDRLVYGVEVSVPNPEGKLRAGMPVEVTIAGRGR